MWNSRGQAIHFQYQNRLNSVVAENGIIYLMGCWYLIIWNYGNKIVLISSKYSCCFSEKVWQPKKEHQPCWYRFTIVLSGYFPFWKWPAHIFPILFHAIDLNHSFQHSINSRKWCKLQQNDPNIDFKFSSPVRISDWRLLIQCWQRWTRFYINLHALQEIDR